MRTDRKVTAQLDSGKPKGRKGVVRASSKPNVGNKERMPKLPAIERKRAEQKIKMILDTAMDGFYLVDLEGRILDANDSYCSMIGYNRAELLKMSIKDIEAVETEQAIKRRIQRILENGSDRFETQHRRKDGSVIAIEASVNYLKDERGKLFVFMRDITNRKQAEILQDAVYRIASATMTAGSLDDLYAEIHRVISRVMPAENFYITIYDKEQDLLKFPYFRDVADEPYLNEVRPEKGLTAYVLRTGKSLLCSQAVHDELERLGEVKLLGEPSKIWLGVPLSIKGKTIGAMVVQHYSDPEAYGEREQHMLEYVSTQVAIAIDRKRAEEKMAASEAELRALFSAMTDVVIVYDADGRYVKIAPTNPINLYRPSDDMLDKTVYDILPREQADYIVAKIGEALETGQVVTGEYSLQIDGKETWFASNAKRLSENSVIWVAHDITERKRTAERIQQQFQRLSTLRNIDLAISSIFDLQVTLNILLEHATAQLGVDAAAILLFHQSMNELEFAAGQGFLTADIRHLRLKLGEDYSGRAALERRTIAIPDLAKGQERFIEGEGFTALFAVPLIAKGKVKGVLEVFHRSPFKADADWLNFLEALASQTAIAIDNSELFGNLQQTNLELQLAYDKTIEGWSRTLDLRNQETEGHTQRVTKTTSRLARIMGLGDDELIQVRRGALLHDIGKMGVPDFILLKPGALAEEEWVIMKKHPQYAFDLLSPIDFLRPALDIPFGHHEKWDGTGYPRGLKGEQIPLTARIFAIVDVYDALTSDRPYRSAWTEEQALEYVKSEAGTHFDPIVVAEFMQILKKD